MQRGKWLQPKQYNKVNYGGAKIIIKLFIIKKN